MSLAALLARPGPVFGSWSQFAGPEPVDILAACGFTFTIVDTEHGVFGLETAAGLVRAAEAGRITALVRVAANDPVLIGKALDAGAAGVVVPKVESAEAARAAVAAARFEPDGRRGACPCVRSGQHFVRDWRAYARRAASEARVVLLLETPEAVRNAREITATPGVAAILLGPFDLSVAMGHEGEWAHPEVLAALDHVVAAARETRRPVVAPVFSAEPAEARAVVARWTERGVRHFTLGTDKLIFAAACARWLDALGGGGAEPEGTPE